MVTESEVGKPGVGVGQCDTVHVGRRLLRSQPTPPSPTHVPCQLHASARRGNVPPPGSCIAYGVREGVCMCVSEPVCARVPCEGGSWGCWRLLPGPSAQRGADLKFPPGTPGFSGAEQASSIPCAWGGPAREVQGLAWVLSGARWVMNPRGFAGGRASQLALRRPLPAASAHWGWPVVCAGFAGGGVGNLDSRGWEGVGGGVCSVRLRQGRS